MSIASDILEGGIRSLLLSNGDTVTFRGSSVLAIIDRTIPAEALQRSEIDLAQSEASEVWMLATSVYGPPRIGETILDNIGLYHAIRAVRRDGVCYKLLCEVNERQ